MEHVAERGALQDAIALRTRRHSSLKMLRFGIFTKEEVIFHLAQIEAR
jgi:hypothetical protein